MAKRDWKTGNAKSTEVEVPKWIGLARWSTLAFTTYRVTELSAVAGDVRLHRPQHLGVRREENDE
jgi:hypothetical protein